ncbi:putative disease resistance protein RGA3 [Trifolium repens]|nr:putative disease resistance protein RGA3 [Trifolium repens]
MAYVLLGIVIENLRSFLREELANFLGVDELTQKLSRNLTDIRAVLQDAEQKQITTRAVKVWLHNLADAAHVLDDILDECLITAKTHVDDKWINRFLPKKILARRNIVKRMKAVAEKIDAIAAEGQKYKLRVGVTEEPRRVDDEWRKSTSFIDEPKVYGRDGDREKVVEFLLRHAVDSEELSVYSIVGIGGLGKTTLAQVVFNDRRVNNHFDFKIWVCVFGFSMMKILESIIESTTGTRPDHSSLESMQKVVLEILRNRRYLLVLDHVWSEDQEKWNKFKYLLQGGNFQKGASVLVTTRQDIFASIIGTYPAHHLGGLSDDDMWSLFKQQAFGANKEERAELVAIGKEIARKCVGSPLAAKVLGIHLRFKSEEHQWISIKECNPWWNLINDDALVHALRQSYLNLKLSSRLCFTFCAVFPKDFEIHKECLIHLWMANGLITSREDLQMEHVGDEVWNELHQKSFFQEVKSDVVGNITFKMHDLFQNLAQSIMGDECVASEVTSLTNLSTRVHHISCFDTKGNFDYNMIPIKKVDSLRTFLEFKPPSKNLDVLLSVAPLRALRTSSSKLSALKSLIHLRYLELCNSDITTLPESVCRLPKLQTLKLEGCIYFSSFPNQLTQLQDLRHLVIENCPSLVSTPFRIGELTCLKTLTIFIVGRSEDGFGLEELHNLQLVGKLHIKGLENVSNEKDAREANLIGKDLNRLYLSWGDYANSQDSDVDAEGVLEALEPHSGLKSFGLKSYGGAHFPPWMRNTSILEGLVHIILYDCKNCKKLPPLDVAKLKELPDELETRCEKGIGEDWPKIAHIPELELEDNFDVKPTFHENTTSEWTMGNQFCHRPKFESVIDVL